MADCIYGVDLGLDGGVASMPVGDIAHTRRMPTLAAPKGKGRVYDLSGITYLLHTPASGSHMFIEKAQLRGAAPASKQGAVSLARCQALWEMACVSAGYSYTIVPARTWQRTMFAGLGKVADTKAASILVAKRLFPRVDLRPGQCRKDQDGLSDALLIAEYGRRQLHQAVATGRDPERPPGHHRSPMAAR